MREKKSERQSGGWGGGETQHPTPPLRASWSLTIWILWCPLYCWQIITNWIPQLSWHTVKADLILLWRYLAVNQLRLWYCATEQRESLIITLITWPKREGEREERERHTSESKKKSVCMYTRSRYNSEYKCEIRSFARVYFLRGCHCVYLLVKQYIYGVLADIQSLAFM